MSVFLELCAHSCSTIYIPTSALISILIINYRFKLSLNHFDSWFINMEIALIFMSVSSFVCSLWQIAGIHPENCRVLKTDSSTEYALSPESLSEAISQDIASGLIPFFLCATVRKLRECKRGTLMPYHCHAIISSSLN